MATMISHMQCHPWGQMVSTLGRGPHGHYASRSDEHRPGLPPALPGISSVKPLFHSSSPTSPDASPLNSMDDKSRAQPEAASQPSPRAMGQEWRTPLGDRSPKTPVRTEFSKRDDTTLAQPPKAPVGRAGLPHRALKRSFSTCEDTSAEQRILPPLSRSTFQQVSSHARYHHESYTQHETSRPLTLPSVHNLLRGPSPKPPHVSPIDSFDSRNGQNTSSDIQNSFDTKRRKLGPGYEEQRYAGRSDSMVPVSHRRPSVTPYHFDSPSTSATNSPPNADHSYQFSAPKPHYGIGLSQTVPHGPPPPHMRQGPLPPMQSYQPPPAPTVSPGSFYDMASNTAHRETAVISHETQWHDRSYHYPPSAAPHYPSAYPPHVPQMPYQSYHPHGLHREESRKRRGNLPKEATGVLRKWYDAHRESPYPNEEDKMAMCAQTGLTMSQVSNWFINARRRTPGRENKQNRSGPPSSDHGAP